MNNLTWRDIHNPSSVAAELTRAAEQEDADLLISAIGRLAIDEWELGAAETAIQALKDDDPAKTGLYTTLANRYLSLSLRPQAINLLAIAQKTARSIIQPWQRAETLTGIAACLSSVYETATAEAVWEEGIGCAMEDQQYAGVQDALDASSVLGQIAEELAVAGYHKRAKEVAADVANPSKRERALLRVGAIVAAVP